MKKLNLTCGSCLYLNRDKVFEKKCTELGKLVSSKACSSHKADAYQLIGKPRSIARLSHIAKGISGMSASELQALAALISAERHTQKYGWRFFQRVYIRVYGAANANYFSNFAVGYVVSADKEHVRIVGDSGKLMVTAMNDHLNGHLPSTVYTVEQFKVLAADMTKKRRFTDNTTSRSVVMAVRKLDDVLVSDEPINKRLSRSATKMDDLVAIVSKMSLGLSPKAKKRSRKSSGELVVDWQA